MKAVLLALAMAAGLLAGCASGPRIVAAEVCTTAAEAPGTTVLQQARYRFVSPAGASPAQQHLQDLAEAALARVGAVRDDAGARVSVQVGLTVGGYWPGDWGAPYPGWSNPRVALGLGVGPGWRGGGLGFGFGWPMFDEPTPVYVTELQLLMRDLSTGQIAYDTRARHHGSSGSGSDALVAALLAAALQGYPNPSAAVRRVDVPLLPASAAEPAASPASAPTPAPTPAPAVR